MLDTTSNKTLKSLKSSQDNKALPDQNGRKRGAQRKTDLNENVIWYIEVKQ